MVGVVSNCVLGAEFGATLAKFNAALGCDDNRVKITGFEYVILTKVNA
jgi:hypothetical protein